MYRTWISSHRSSSSVMLIFSTFVIIDEEMKKSVLCGDPTCWSSSPMWGMYGRFKIRRSTEPVSVAFLGTLSSAPCMLMVNLGYPVHLVMLEIHLKKLVPSQFTATCWNVIIIAYLIRRKNASQISVTGMLYFTLGVQMSYIMYYLWQGLCRRR